jgi:predicted signal transduction protein with EAL and GGDEF domain
VARVGGDEFTILLPDIEELETVTDIARRLLECLRLPRQIGPQEFRTTGSIGITMFPADGYDGDTLLRNADTAMYRAKEAGRDNYQLYTRSMNERMLERLAFENDLRHALAREELTLYYQPILDVKTSSVTGAEALIRWQHPVRGIVAPDAFIPFAEESGLIVEIGEWVLRAACHQIRQWDAAGLALGRVAVNLSARQLQQEDLAKQVRKILEETGVSPEQIALEITEGAVLVSAEHVTATLNELRDMGIKISLDDFGTGYSSLTYLKRFPVEVVKIDRSFVRDIEHDASDATIVSTVIAMAESMNLTVVAEGVETEAQLGFLRERGCDEFQGYLVSAPVPPEELQELLMGRANQRTRTPARARTPARRTV